MKTLLVVAAVLAALIGSAAIAGLAAGNTVLPNLAGLAGLGVLALAGYVTPTLVAYRRGHAQRQAIAWLNLLLGWSVFGWAAAMVWAATNPITVTPARDSGEPVKACPDCAETIKAAAMVCRFCGHRFEGY